MSVGTEPPRVVCLGEAMVMVRPDGGGSLAGTDLLRRSVGGAEANVAVGLAGQGVPTAWVSRLGADPFGDVVVQDLVDRGVRVLAERDAERPTGLYLKDKLAGGGSRMHYYRAGSAAAAMDAAVLDRPEVTEALAAADVVHTSGITAGIISPDSRLLTRLCELRDRYGFVLSVDLNWRPALWGGHRPVALVELLRAADVVLLGADEAGQVLGVEDARSLRVLLGPRPRLVIKSDSHAAAEQEPDGRLTEVPALLVEVVEPVGAGDGFAAGYLAGLLNGWGPEGRLRLGHLVAAGVLATPGDHAPPPDAETCATVVAGSADDWAATRVTSRGVESPAVDAGRGPAHRTPGGAR